MLTERRSGFLVVLATLALLGQLGACSPAPQPEVAGSSSEAHLNQLAVGAPAPASKSPLQSSSLSAAAAAGEPEAAAAGSQATAPSPTKVDKLKRGLASFLNKNNPASFFVPSLQQVGGLASLKGPAGSSDSATLVNAEPSADSLIKGPNRLAHTRPIGGPLRWGR